MRKPRKLKPGAKYHVTARINRKEHIFKIAGIKELFLKTLTQAKGKYSFTIDNFCIMNNHIHLIIKPNKKENLSYIMQWVLSVFAIRFNRFFNYSGHVWYDRFRSKIIGSIRQYYATFLYVSNNPVKAEMVKSPFDYPYSGINQIKLGIYDLLERPPNNELKYLWRKLRNN